MKESWSKIQLFGNSEQLVCRNFRLTTQHAAIEGKTQNNPILAKLFRMVKLAENAGFGFDKIDVNWKAYNSTLPEYQIEFDSVILNFQLESYKEGSSKKELVANDYERLRMITNDYRKKNKIFFYS